MAQSWNRLMGEKKWVNLSMGYVILVVFVRVGGAGILVVYLGVLFCFGVDNDVSNA